MIAILLLSLQSNFKSLDMKPYDKQTENDNNKSSEPEALYGNVHRHSPVNLIKTKSIPEGYMTLDEFGELFHQKLEACYEKLQNDNKQ
ncbi:MAG: hypothetical protein J6T37_01210 [Bacteroidales bacterium]|nr:hypothetical protein [Bacteroidales bacterium]